MKSKGKICFLSLNSSTLLTDYKTKYTGGAEVQQVELAKELNRRNWDVSFITYGKGNEEKYYDGIKIFQVYKRNEVKHISTFKKILSIWNLMNNIDTDVFLYRTGSPGIVSFFCKFKNKKLIKHIASNSEVTGEEIIKKKPFHSFLSKIAIDFDIKNADIIVSQNYLQKKILKDRYGKDSFLIRNAFELCKKVKLENRKYVLWVGMIRPVKNPKIFIELAAYFPKHQFIMIGGKGENDNFYEKIKRRAEERKNITFKGFVPHNKIFQYYKEAQLLVNTSKVEGFPNIFIEAWMHSIPVVSLNVDPDGIISKYDLGYYSKNFENLIQNVKTILENNDLRYLFSNNARKYVEKNHDIKEVAKKYEEVIKKLI